MGDLTEASSADMAVLRRWPDGGNRTGNAAKRLQKLGLLEYMHGYRSITPAGIAALARQKETK